MFITLLITVVLSLIVLRAMQYIPSVWLRRLACYVASLAIVDWAAGEAALLITMFALPVLIAELEDMAVQISGWIGCLMSSASRGSKCQHRHFGGQATMPIPASTVVEGEWIPAWRGRSLEHSAPRLAP